ncbi:MAG: hypothetical protein NC122_10440, partial [Faecalibacterium sp.]|nr:hypothetical protein [Faecalibacterium sp.]
CGAEGSQEFVLNFKNGLFAESIFSNSLKINVAREENQPLCDVLIIEFMPFKLKDKKIMLSLVYELGSFDRFFKKYIRLECEDGQSCLSVLDYIDFAPILIHDKLKFWRLPEQKKSHTGGFYMSLGQPVFLASTFIGCEFPATVNTVEDGAACVKYYSGKPLGELFDDAGVYVSHKYVCGVADADSMPRLKAAFFDYIRTISKPCKFNVQYNSWYDHMLNISGEKIEHSFLEIEKNLTRAGTKPLDRYVIDDGWNDYAKGFWNFNSKFPNELYPSSNLTKALGSTLGLWLGPRGGYTSDTPKFAKQIEKNGNGYFSKYSWDVDVSSDKYIKKVSDFLSDCQSKFDLSYWKLDGFSRKPCRNKNHDHMVGGKNDMYYYSELFEKWTDVFERLSAESDGNVFLNLTCYMPVSPWLLQWANTLWIQVSDDMGMIKRDANGKKMNASQKDMLLSYRDQVYYDFNNVRQFCFPASNLYNHDPIYGNEAKISMTDDEFREYLFTMAMRGTCFWELYYSYNMMNDAKWRINNAALRFIEDNLDVITRSVQFGGSPALGQVYGFGCFGYDEGIVAVRNSGGTAQQYVLRLGHEIGAEIGLKDVELVTILPYSTRGTEGTYSFGDTIKLQLAPFETRILHFGKKSQPMKAAYIRTMNENTVEVMFNQTAVTDSIKCFENPIASIELLEDYMTARITFEKPFNIHDQLTLCGVKDILLKSSDVILKFAYYKDDIITDGCIFGDGDFSIVATTGGEENYELFSQGNEIRLWFENDRCHFMVGGSEVVSQLPAHTVVQVCAVRERNGVLKLYLNKHLDSGIRPKTEPLYLVGGNATGFDENRIKLYSRALAYDEV